MPGRRTAFGGQLALLHQPVVPRIQTPGACRRGPSRRGICRGGRAHRWAAGWAAPGTIAGPPGLGRVGDHRRFLRRGRGVTALSPEHRAPPADGAERPVRHRTARGRRTEAGTGDAGAFLENRSMTGSGGQGESPADAEALLSPRLSVGDRVRLISPASFPTAEWVEEPGTSPEDWGLVVDIGRHAVDQWGFMAGRDQDRLDDLNDALRDPGVRAVIAIVGGAGPIESPRPVCCTELLKASMVRSLRPLLSARSVPLVDPRAHCIPIQCPPVHCHCSRHRNTTDTPETATALRCRSPVCRQLHESSVVLGMHQ
jgi:hypothetical protein